MKTSIHSVYIFVHLNIAKNVKICKVRNVSRDTNVKYSDTFIAYIKQYIQDIRSIVDGKNL